MFKHEKSNGWLLLENSSDFSNSSDFDSKYQNKIELVHIFAWIFWLYFLTFCVFNCYPIVLVPLSYLI